MAARATMTEDELLAIVGQHIEQAVGFLGGKLSEQRSESMRYYLAQPFGDEIEGRSQYISTDVADTIEWMLPQLLEPFVAGDSVVRFNPVGEEDVEAAQQETDYVNHIFMKDNKGFMVLYTWFKDALLSKNGFVKAWAEQYQTVQEERYEGLTVYQVATLLSDSEIEFLATTEQPTQQAAGEAPDAGAGSLWDVEVKRTSDKKRIRVKAIPPEHFLIDRRATSIEDAEFTGHRESQTESELILEGHDPEIVHNLPDINEGNWTEERHRRFSYDDQYPFDDFGVAGNKAAREIWTTECFVKVDWDDDGIAELRRVKIAGITGAVNRSGTAGTTLLVNEHWPHEHPPFYSLTPQPITHKFYGQSIADIVMDIQRVRSTIIRQMLDATYLSTSPRLGINERTADIEDALVVRAGALIRTKVPPAEALYPIPTQPPDQATYSLLEFMTNEREARTGISRYNQGLDASSLNDTASGVNQILTQAQMRTKLIARLFAEAGVAELFCGIHELARKYQDVPRMVRLRGKWVEVDPSDWRGRMDTTVEVGIGAANRDLQLLHIEGIAQAQAQIIMAQGGVEGPLVTAREVYNMMEKRAELASYKEPNLFARNPDDPANAVQAKAAPPDPKMLEIQADMQKASAELQQKAQESAAKLRQEAEKAAADIQLKYEELAAKMRLEDQKLQLERQKHEDEKALAFAKLDLERAEIASDRESHDLAVIGKQIERAQTEQASARARGETAPIEAKGQMEVEKLRAQTAKFQAELTDKQLALAGAERSKRMRVERGRDGKIIGAVIVEGPETVQ